MQLHILIIDDDVGIRKDLSEFFSQKNNVVFDADLPSKALEILEKNEIDVMILDLKLPEMNGVDFLKKIKPMFPDIEVIMITGHGDTRNVVEAMKLGAFDFFSKPFRLLDLQAAIERTHKFLSLHNKLKRTEFNYKLVVKELQKKLNHQLIGESQANKTVLEWMTKVAQTDATSVLITGESGVGKELVARGIHALSPRKASPFCEVNCTAIPHSLFERELFGHAKGSFTGASQDQSGYFEAAHNGTLFLDEIGDASLSCQTKLLKVIEEKKIKRIGSHKEMEVDVRIISATNQNLDRLVEQKQFRLDLLHRINTFIIQVPPLRERPQDIVPLLKYYANFFAQKLRKQVHDISEEVISAAKKYSFPGNIRELKNLVERAVILCDGTRLELSHISFSENSFSKLCNSFECPGENNALNLDRIIKKTILEALNQSEGNKSKAARLLGISRQSLERRIEKFDLLRKN